MSDPICIKTFNNRQEAEIAKELLNSHGISAFVSADDVGGLIPVTSPARLLVNEQDAEKAVGILDSIDK